jgi:uncharacterized protein (TIGR04255 family)
VSDLPDPLTGPLPKEVPLPNAPLVRVLAQVRFPEIVSLGTDGFVAPFQETVRSEYGILERAMAKTIEFGPAGTVDHPARTSAWRFLNTSREWCVTLAADFLTIETRAYTSRNDFLGRLEHVLTALDDCVEPATVHRIGVRYVDRVPNITPQDATALIRPDARGLLGTDMASRARFHLVDNLFDLPEERRLRARWGMLAANMTIDPLTVEPISESCWVLDLDAFVEGEQPMDVTQIASHARALAEHAYMFFRWVVTDEFLRRFGGTP